MRDNNEEASLCVPISEAILRYRFEVAKLGLTNPWNEENGGQRIGTGRHGEAFRLPSGDVLKLTNDSDEAAVSKLLIGRPTRHVVSIRSVHLMSDTAEDEEYKPWFAVVREYLYPPPAKDISVMKVMHELYEDETYDLWFSPSRSMQDRWRSALRDALSFEEVTRALAIYRDVVSGAQELRAVGFDWTDFHDENILVDKNGVRKIVDVGWGQWRSEEVELTFPDLRDLNHQKNGVSGASSTPG